MKVTSELNLTNFEFWAGAKNHSFTYSELKELEDHFEDLFYNGSIGCGGDLFSTETDINDLFWFEEEFLCELLGIDFDEYSER